MAQNGVAAMHKDKLAVALANRLVWGIDRRLQEDQARPIIYYLRFVTCWQPRVKGLRMMVNSVFNGWRFDDVWLDE